MIDAQTRVRSWLIAFSLLATLAPPARPATLTIGAAAPYPSLAAAYAAARPGDVLEIADSRTYNESLAILKADLTLRAAPGATPTIRGKGASFGAAVFVAADGVTLEGLTLDGIDRSGRVIASLAPTRLAIRDNRIVNGDYGIYTLYTAGSPQGFRIEGNDLSDNRTDIWLHNVSGAWVADNLVHSSSGSGIGIGGYSSDIDVVGNRATADLPPGRLSSRYGILVSGNDNRVEHNEVHGNTRGIVLSWSAGNRIARNRVYDNIQYNFSLVGARNNALVGNLDFFTGALFAGGLSVLLDNASGNRIEQHSSVGAGRGIWFTQNAGPCADNAVRDSLIQNAAGTGSYALDATAASFAQGEIANLAIRGFRTPVRAGLPVSGLRSTDPELTADLYLSPASWALTAGSQGQYLGALGLDPHAPPDGGLESPSALAPYETRNLSADGLGAGGLTIADPRDGIQRDAGLLGRASHAGDLDLIVRYRDHAILNPGYQGSLAVMLAGPDYEWDTDRPAALLTHRIHDTIDASWYDLIQPATATFKTSHPGRRQEGYLRLARQAGLIRAWYWGADRWQPVAGPGLGIPSDAPLRPALRMRSNWNDDYAVEIAQIQVSPDADGDGLLDAEEAAIGSFPQEPDSDADGAPDGADLAPRDGRVRSPTPATLAGDAALSYRWLRDRDGVLFVVAHNQGAGTASVRIPASGLEAGDLVALPLEESAIRAGRGAIVDSLPPFARRLYRIAAHQVSLLSAEPPAGPLVQPRDGPWTLDLNAYALDLYGARPLAWSLVATAGDALAATLTGATLTLAHTGSACGPATVRVRAENGLGQTVELDLPLVALGSPGPNLLANPDFEEAGTVPGQIPGWRHYTWTGAGLLVQDAGADGRSARLQGLDDTKSAIHQSLTLPAGRYRVTARVASWDLRAGADGLASRLHLALGDAGDRSLRLVSGDTDWTAVETVFSIPTDRTVTLYVFVDGPGYLWVDDLRLAALEPCAADTDGSRLAGPTGQALDFVPPPTASDLVLKPYCDDPGMAGAAVCRRLAGIDPADLRPPRAAGAQVLAAFDPPVPVGDSAGFLDLGDLGDLPADWSGWDYLEIEIDNPGPETLDGYVEIRDRYSTDYWSRVNWYTQLVPGGQTLRIPLQIFVGEKSVIKERRRLDLTAVTHVFLGLIDPGQVRVSGARLTLEQPYANDFPRLIKLDGGTDTSPVFHGFTALTPAMGYRPEYGIGLAPGTVVARAEDRRHPDELLRDWISIASGGVDLDLPNGTYQVWMMLEDPGYWEYVQSYDYRAVYAEGSLVHSQTMRADDLWARLFAHTDDEDLPGDDIWQRYIAARYRPVEFRVAVTDGQLNLGFVSDAYFTYANTLSALLIWPADRDAQGQAFVAELWGRLRDHFAIEYAETPPPASDPDAPATTQDETLPGLLIYRRPPDRDILAGDRPDLGELASALDLELARGETEPLSLGLYARTDLTLTRAELNLPGLATGLYRVRHKIRRTAPGGTRYSALPHLLDGLTLPLALPAGQSRQIWIEVAAPPGMAGSQATRVEGSLALGLADGSQVTLPVTVRIAPFDLPAADIPFGYLGSVPVYPGSPFQQAVDARARADIAPALGLALDQGMTSYSGGLGGPVFSGYDAGGAVRLDTARLDSVLGAAAGDFAFAPLSYGGLAPSGGLGFETYGIADTLARYGRPHTQVLRDVLGAVRAHTQGRGWPEPVYTVGDEPGESSIPQVAAFADAIRAAGSRTSVFTSFTGAAEPRAALAAHVDQVYLSHHNAQSLALVLQNGNDCGTYNLGGRYARGLYQWKLRSLGCRAGYYQFAFNATHADPYYALDGREDDLAAALPAPEPGRLIPTLELARFREAVDDYRYLLALERALESPVDPQAAAGARAWLADLIAGLAADHRTLADPPLDSDALADMRATARLWIEEVLGQTAP